MSKSFPALKEGYQPGAIMFRPDSFDMRSYFKTATQEEEEQKASKKRNAPPEPDPKAEGSPHSIIEKPGSDGQYTTHNGDGTFKQYRGSGKPHGNIPRPNIKETKMNPSPNGPIPGKPEVRKPTPDEIPKRN